MQVYRNLTYIRKRETLGKRLFLVAVIALAGGLMVSFMPNVPAFQATDGQNPILDALVANYAVISFAALIVGFITASIGSFFINRFSPRRWPHSKWMERPDEAFARVLRGLDDQYALYSWVLPGVAQLLAGPCGLIVFVVRSDKGRIVVQGDRWREPFTFARLLTLFAREGLGNPAREIDEEIKAVQRALQAMEEEQPASARRAVPVTGAVAFIHDDLRLEVDNPRVPVLRGPAVVAYVRRTARGANVKNSEMRQFRRELEEHLDASRFKQSAE